MKIKFLLKRKVSFVLLALVLYGCSAEDKIVFEARKHLSDIKTFTQANDVAYYVDYRNGERYEGIFIEDSKVLNSATEKERRVISSFCAVRLYSAIPDSIFHSIEMEVKVKSGVTSSIERFKISDIKNVIRNMETISKYVSDYNNSSTFKLLENFDEGYQKQHTEYFVTTMNNIKTMLPQITGFEFLGYEVIDNQMELIFNFLFSGRIQQFKFTFERGVDSNRKILMIEG